MCFVPPLEAVLGAHQGSVYFNEAITVGLHSEDRFLVILNSLTSASCIIPHFLIFASDRVTGILHKLNFRARRTKCVR
jgi:hypothetical protein